MTSEVVVMNRLGIALASDSAATVYIDGRAKLYQADKLFMVSQCHPVGAMIYNNSSLLGVPWETILKMFRRELGSRGLPSLEDYGRELMKYLGEAHHLFPADVQQQYYLKLVETLYRGIRVGIEEAIEEAIFRMVEEGTMADADLHEREAARVIQATLHAWRSKNDAECFEPGFKQELAGLSTQLSGNLQILLKLFEPWKLKAPEVEALRELATLVVLKDEILHESLSGLVIAGFGEEEHLPVMQSFELGEIVLGRLKHRMALTKRIDAATASVVEPFAQSGMVNTFLNGISPSFELKLIEEVGALIFGLPELVVDSLPKMSRKRKEEIKNQLLPRSEEILNRWAGEFERHRDEKHSDPILQSIAFLPKNELAHVASSLVNLNSFQKRMSIREDETVGGPIDVAVISKGDGFVWIERKHYFKPELNQHFFTNYGMQSSNGGRRNAKEAQPGDKGDGSD